MHIMHAKYEHARSYLHAENVRSGKLICTCTNDVGVCLICEDQVSELQAGSCK